MEELKAMNLVGKLCQSLYCGDLLAKRHAEKRAQENGQRANGGVDEADELQKVVNTLGEDDHGLKVTETEPLVLMKESVKLAEKQFHQLVTLDESAKQNDSNANGFPENELLENLEQRLHQVEVQLEDYLETAKGQVRKSSMCIQTTNYATPERAFMK